MSPPVASRAPGIIAGGQLDGYIFIFDTTLAGSATDQAVMLTAIPATVSVS
jgi:hypothetical protein